MLHSSLILAILESPMAFLLSFILLWTFLESPPSQTLSPGPDYLAKNNEYDACSYQFTDFFQPALHIWRPLIQSFIHVTHWSEIFYGFPSLQNPSWCWMWWCTPIIPELWDAGAGESLIQDQPGQLSKRFPV